ncbi:MAG: hypothetical protein FJ218_01530 [Ignavibacteria bacterium]|nr:hypothetical protein [Ignavibacteria bacterium]
MEKSFARNQSVRFCISRFRCIHCDRRWFISHEQWRNNICANFRYTR